MTFLRSTLLASTVVSATLSLVSAATWAQAAPKPEALIKSRQSAFQYVAWSSGRIKANLDGTYSKDEVIKASNSIAALANSGLPALFAPGTEQGKGWHDTAAKPELFKDGKRFEELASDFGREANELAKLAAQGDAGAVKTQYAKLSRTCKTCHDDFKAKD